MDDYKKTNLELWEQYVDVNSKAESYHMDRFMKGGILLHDLEREEVGDVKGKSLLHLQCHFGRDTLSWARLGAKVTGMDFSPKGIELARGLAKQFDIPANFICCDLYSLPQHLDEQFDVVFTSYGILCWLPDIPRWAQIVASYVKPGGIFYIAEFHPFGKIFDEEKPGYSIRYPYFQKEPFREWAETSYADAITKIKPVETFEWNYQLGEVVTSLIQAGLQIEFLHEQPYTVDPFLVDLVDRDEQTSTFREDPAPFPLMFSIRAKKPA